MTIRSALSVRLLAAFLALFAGAALFAPAEARAQACTEDPCPGTGDDGLHPLVTISPASGTYTQPTLPARALLSDAHLKDGTLQVLWTAGGTTTNVTAAFAYVRTLTTPTMQDAMATGQLTMSAGSNLLSVTMCDYNRCTTSTATYHFGTPGVRVTPDGGLAQVPAGTASAHTFYVRNTSPAAASFALQASCRNAGSGDPVAGCSAPASVTVPAGDSVAVSLSMAGSSAGAALLARLSASLVGSPSVSDAGWRDVEVRGAAGSGVGAPQISVIPVNPGLQVDRAQCLTVSAGAGAAMECGDLRLAHGMPGMMTRGKARAPALIYNSEHAHPRPIVYADVTLPAGYAVPTQIRATLTLNGVTLPDSVWSGGDWAPGTTRRIAVQADGWNLATAVYAYSLQVTSVYGSSQYPVTHYGELTVVNRKDSPYGAGWWLAGLEQFQYLPDGARVFWIGGDGSTRVFTWIATNTSVAPALTRPDTMNGIYVGTQIHQFRRLPGGTEVWFDTVGRHARTINRLGDT
ncbi:MAG TPA: hypothetical protein VK358_17390, partial [Longimicrobium sp.]|nr:hypothetical protein [Longimicrobium sp.]